MNSSRCITSYFMQHQQLAQPIASRGYPKQYFGSCIKAKLKKMIKTRSYYLCGATKCTRARKCLFCYHIHVLNASIMLLFWWICAHKWRHSEQVPFGSTTGLHFIRLVGMLIRPDRALCPTFPRLAVVMAKHDQLARVFMSRCRELCRRNWLRGWDVFWNFLTVGPVGNVSARQIGGEFGFRSFANACHKLNIWPSCELHRSVT